MQRTRLFNRLHCRSTVTFGSFCRKCKTVALSHCRKFYDTVNNTTYLAPQCYTVMLLYFYTFLCYFPFLLKRMRAISCLLACVSVYPPVLTLEFLNQSIRNLVYMSGLLTPYQHRNFEAPPICNNQHYSLSDI
jgi:hypothetical protein